MLRIAWKQVWSIRRSTTIYSVECLRNRFIWNGAGWRKGLIDAADQTAVNVKAARAYGNNRDHVDGTSTRHGWSRASNKPTRYVRKRVAVTWMA
jgi:hypothetical protein